MCLSGNVCTDIENGTRYEVYSEGIADDPITGSGKTCGTAGYGQIGLDKTAQTMAADAESFPAQASAVYENFLRCDQRPPEGSMCTWSRSNPLGSNTTDAIVLHVYTGAAIYPERFLYSIAQFRETCPRQIRRNRCLLERAVGGLTQPKRIRI